MVFLGISSFEELQQFFIPQIERGEGASQVSSRACPSVRLFFLPPTTVLQFQKRTNFEEDEEKTFYPTRRSGPGRNPVGCGGWRLTPEQETGSAGGFRQVFFLKKNNFLPHKDGKLIFCGYKFHAVRPLQIQTFIYF